MNCTYHIQNPISIICIAPHMCQYQRKLCFECLYEQDVNVKQTVVIKKFQEMVIKKFKESKLDETSELIKQRNNFKSVLSQTESTMKKIWEELSESIKQVYDWIEQEYFNIINQSTNLAESSYADLEKLVQIVIGTKLNDLNGEKNWFLMKLEKTQNCLVQEIEGFIQKFKKEMQEIQSLIIKKEFKSQPLIQSDTNLENPNQQWQFSQQLTFSTTYKHSSCSVTQKSGKVIENNLYDWQWYCCMCDQMIPKNDVIQFAFKIIEIGYIMIGIGFRDIVQSKGYYQCYQIGGGTYNIANCGYCYNHDQQDKNNKRIAFPFTTNDIIIVEVDIVKKYVKWTKQFTNESFTLAINTSKDLYPCVHLSYKCKVEILNQVIK
ncbi:unnamed protein product [Paramecium sonneborni]|uniref:Uncharacterized protein n=1 Tax=Paramecium sonneborni TaxID=65129 RepID=A0A8S1QC29_9CILI|nr:unnamed protein product [Paramecium sonneborni]